MDTVALHMRMMNICLSNPREQWTEEKRALKQEQVQGIYLKLMLKAIRGETMQYVLFIYLKLRTAEGKVAL